MLYMPCIYGWWDFGADHYYCHDDIYLRFLFDFGWGTIYLRKPLTRKEWNRMRVSEALWLSRWNG